MLGPAVPTGRGHRTPPMKPWTVESLLFSSYQRDGLPLPHLHRQLLVEHASQVQRKSVSPSVAKTPNKKVKKRFSKFPRCSRLEFRVEERRRRAKIRVFAICDGDSSERRNVGWVNGNGDVHSVVLECHQLHVRPHLQFSVFLLP